MSLGQYLAACVVLGIGIAIDVAIATLSRARLFSDIRVARRWTVRITLTHTLFPMLGYYPVALYVMRVDGWLFAAGIAAAALVMYFVVGAYRAWRQGEAQDAEKAGVEWALVLAVSWDALFSGPAKAAQAVNWNEREVLLSFFIAGGVVAATAAAAVNVARSLAASHLSADAGLRLMATRQTVAFGLELSVLTYFAGLAIARMVFRWTGPWPLLLTATIVVVGALFVADRRQLIAGRMRTIRRSSCSA
jgi:hypothetical protein